MKILVLGGTRFFGKRLVECLLKQGHEVTILTRGLTKDSFGNKIKRIVCLRSDRLQMEKSLKDKDFDIVYDQICFSPDDAAITCDIFQKRLKKYIFTSSVYIYSGRQAGIFRESDFNPAEHEVKMGTRATLSYEEGKRLAEIYFAKKAAFKVVQVRFPIVMGADDYTGRFGFYIKKILDGETMQVPKSSGKMNYINADGAADFLTMLQNGDSEGPINAASPESFNLIELLKQFESILKSKVKIIEIEMEEESLPFYRKENLVMNMDRASSLGYQFSSFFSWFEKEVRLAAANILNGTYYVS